MKLVVARTVVDLGNFAEYLGRAGEVEQFDAGIDEVKYPADRLGRICWHNVIDATGWA